MSIHSIHGASRRLARRRSGIWSPRSPARFGIAFLVGALGALLLGGTDARAQESGKSSDPARSVGRMAPGEDNSYFHVNARIRIPKPLLDEVRAGRCAVWYPERGRDDYTAALPCSSKPAVQPGGILLAPSKDPAILEAAVYHAITPSLIIARGAFDARTGLLLRAIDPDRPMDVDARRDRSGASSPRQ